MESVSFWLQAAALLLLVILSALFSASETSLMSLNRYRLGHLVREGRRGARLTSTLLTRTDRLLGTILLGNNAVNTLLTGLVTALAIRYFGNNDSVILAATTIVAIVVIVFCEILPKVIGAANPERLALPLAFFLRPLMSLFSPVLWLVNQVTGRILRALGIDPSAKSADRMSLEEMRTIVLESGHFIPAKHRSILLNLFDLELITVDDVMIPRSRIEGLDITAGVQIIRERLASCYHNKLPVYEGEVNRVIGVLHVRRALSLLQRDTFDTDNIRELLNDPYFIPSGTPVFTQLQFFQENRQRVGLVVDEYGEVLGLVTLENIIEEVIGDFTTTVPGGTDAGLKWDEQGEVIVEGGVSLRELNRRLNTHFDLSGPRTLNGLVLEALQELPQAATSLRLGGVVVEIVHVEDRLVRSARLRRPADASISQTTTEA